jgi:2-polyprenyl-3-methyl-5-hydroxy-6-metoxy-1,4-benzoquinol methylase
VTQISPNEKSNGYEEIAEQFIRRRDSRIGASTVRSWSKGLPPGTAVLDLGCGNGVPISRALIDDGFTIYGVDASEKMISEFRSRFPEAHAEHCAVEDSSFFGRTFDGIVAWGLMFLLAPEVQEVVLRRVAAILNIGGKFLFTSPQQVRKWTDCISERESVSLGIDEYRKILEAAGLKLAGEDLDEGENHYYLVSKS